MHQVFKKIGEGSNAHLDDKMPFLGILNSDAQEHKSQSEHEATTQEIDDAIEEVKQIIEKYGTESDIWGMKNDFGAVADRLHVPFEIKEEAVFPENPTKDGESRIELRHRSVMLGNKG